MVVSAAIAAALVLPGCAPAGYNEADYTGGGAVDAAANEVEASPTAEPEPSPTGEAADNDKAAELSEDEITSELTGTSVKRMGKVVVNQEGFVLYRFDEDKNKPESQSNCDGDCERVWPAALTEDGEPTLDGVDSEKVGTVTRADGTKQLTLDGWPLYTYAGDKKPGQWLGQNVSGKWFVVNPNGTKNLTCLPKVSKPVAPPSDEEDPADEDDSGNGGSDISY